jgi:hypothetical protein
VLAEAATIGGAKLVLTVRLYLGLIAPSRERPSVTEDSVIILLSPPIFIAGGVPRFMMALSIVILNSNRRIGLCFQRLGNM